MERLILKYGTLKLLLTICSRTWNISVIQATDNVISQNLHF